MEAPKRIVLLLVGFGVGEMLAEELSAEERQASPVFAPIVATETVTLANRTRPELSAVGQQLASLIRSDGRAVPPPAVAGTAEDAATPGRDTLQLEKMTVKAKMIFTPVRRETVIEKFTRTGYLWEFSPTKRIMLGPNGDKVGLMFSWDW